MNKILYCIVELLVQVEYHMYPIDFYEHLLFDGMVEKVHYYYRNNIVPRISNIVLY